MYQVGFTQGEKDATHGIYSPPISTTEEPDLHAQGYEDGHRAMTNSLNEED